MFTLLDTVNERSHIQGSDFAPPSQMIYMAHDYELDPEKRTAAEKQVQDWRAQRQLPFPDFAPSEKTAFRGAIAYPHPESAVGGRSKTSG